LSIYITRINIRFQELRKQGIAFQKKYKNQDKKLIP